MFVVSCSQQRNDLQSTWGFKSGHGLSFPRAISASFDIFYWKMNGMVSWSLGSGGLFGSPKLSSATWSILRLMWPSRLCGPNWSHSWGRRVGSLCICAQCDWGCFGYLWQTDAQLVINIIWYKISVWISESAEYVKTFCRLARAWLRLLIVTKRSSKSDTARHSLRRIQSKRWTQGSHRKNLLRFPRVPFHDPISQLMLVILRQSNYQDDFAPLPKLTKGCYC